MRWEGGEEWTVWFFSSKAAAEEILGRNAFAERGSYIVAEIQGKVNVPEEMTAD